MRKNSFDLGALTPSEQSQWVIWLAWLTQNANRGFIAVCILEGTFMGPQRGRAFVRVLFSQRRMPSFKSFIASIDADGGVLFVQQRFRSPMPHWNERKASLSRSKLELCRYATHSQGCVAFFFWGMKTCPEGPPESSRCGISQYLEALLG
jgi:hypothetical protein